MILLALLQDDLLFFAYPVVFLMRKGYNIHIGDEEKEYTCKLLQRVSGC